MVIQLFVNTTSPEKVKVEKIEQASKGRHETKKFQPY